ncbi:MAG TPA: TolC family protein [Terriglobales bacterium]|nr:TolC family protein [Terriglobales bacterium]
MRIERVAVLVLSLVLIFGVATFGGTQDASSSQAPAAQQPASPPPAPSAAAAASKTAPKLADYSRPRSHFPNPIAPYMTRSVDAAFLGNSPRIEQLLQNGKIMLSLDDAIALALENNLDLAIARYNLSIADTDILRAKAGQSTRGVNTGVVQGTPGGGVGGFGTGAQGAGAGGTTSGAGGAGAGTGGLVLSTSGVGPAVESFDPFVTSTLSIEHAVFPLSNTVTTGVPTLNQNSVTANFNYSQGWATGTDMGLTFDNSRQISNSKFTSLQPSINSSFRFQLRQHLLQGFGFQPNLRFIRIARNDRRISDSAFRQQVETTVSQIQNIYWDLVNAYEDVKVKERSVTLAQKTLSDNQKQVQIGTLAPIEVVRAQSDLSTRQQDLIVSQTNLELQQSLIKNAVTRSMAKGSPLPEAPVIPTDTMQLPPAEAAPVMEDLVQQALNNRPEIEQSNLDLTNREISEKAAKNALLPQVDLFGFYGAAGLAGDPTAALLCGSPSAPAPPNCRFNTGLPNAFARLFDSSAPDKGVGVNLIIPIRNRAAQADSVRSQLEYRQAELRLQQLRNQIGIEVRNAQFALQQNRARVQAAQDGQKLAEQSLDAEQKKYALGASTNTLVLQAQRDVATAESNLVAAMSAYEKSRVELDRVTGQTLPNNHIQLGEAEVGVVTTPLAVPYVVPRPPEQQPQAAPPLSQPPQTPPAN